MKFWLTLACFGIALLPLVAQDAPASTKPTEHVVGTVSAAEPSAGIIRVKEDNTETERAVELQNTKTLLKVAPGATDLKSATRITAGDLAAGDRVDVRGFKSQSDPNGIVARSVILMSGRDVQQMHRQESAAWQRSTAGVVNSIDVSGGKLMMTARTPEGPQPMTVDAGKAQFIRYSPEHPQTPSPSQLSEIQVGDQIKILGERSPDGATVAAQKIYSGSFRTVAGTVSSVSSDGKRIVLKDLTTKQQVTVTLGDGAAVRRLPPPMAFALARRFNPDFKGAPPGGAAQPSNGRPSEAADNGAPPRSPQRSGGEEEKGAAAGSGPGGFGRMRAANGDLSQLLERIPPMAVTDLKSGDAVIVSGSPSPANKAVILASNVVAGVEPIFQSASPRQMQSLGDWGSSLNMGEGAMGGQQP